MSNINGFYEGQITPHWNEIDKIHYGAASTLNPQEDNIFLGRYVLVKYTKFVYSQDTINVLITTSKAELSGNDLIWRNCYDADNTQEKMMGNCDGVVFKKIYDNTLQAVTYTPIAQLSTSYSFQSFNDALIARLGTSFAEDKTLTVEKYIQNQQTHENFARLENAILEVDSKLNSEITAQTKYIDDEIAELKDYLLTGDIAEVYNQLVEISTWIEGPGVNATELTDAIAIETKQREEIDTALQNDINQLQTNINTKENESKIRDDNLANKIAQHSKDISNLSKFAIVDVSVLPDLNVATLGTLYRLTVGQDVEIWWVEVQEDNSYIWKQVGIMQAPKFTWKEF